MMLRPHINRAARGFTLIELMLAVAVLGLVLSMLASSFSVVAHSKIHAEGRLAVDREGRAVLWQLSKELRSAVQTPVALSRVLLVGTGHTGSSGATDSITFSTLDAGHRRALTGLGTEMVVTYNMVNNPNHPGWYLLQRSQQSGLLLGGGDTQATVLADNLLSLRLGYYDGQRWIESWDSNSMPRSRQLPVAVRIELQMAAPGGRAMDFATRVTVPMAIATW
jgi:prepilin-type N-terminal cleavage/methylation domain-containing protein